MFALLLAPKNLLAIFIFLFFVFRKKNPNEKRQRKVGETGYEMNKKINKFLFFV
jgi:hypothetical protein